MNLKTIGLALVASAFMTSTAFAQAGTMQPIPNPPEKPKMMKHHKMHHHHMAKKDDMAKGDMAKGDMAKGDMAKGSMAKKDDKAAMATKK